MGIYVSTSGITVNLHQNKQVYFTDEPLSGTVNWSNEDQTVQTSEIYIMLIGEIGYTTQEMVGPGANATSTRTKYHHVPFYSSKISLARPLLEEELIVFPEGQYSWPFEFSLTNHLPPTMNSPTHYPHVRYYLQVIIERSWYIPNTKELRYLTIYPRINLSDNSQWLQQNPFEKQNNRKKILLKGFTNKTAFVPGESIDFTIEIDNPREVRIKYIHLTIFQSFIIGVNSKKRDVFETTLPTIEDTNRRQIKETVSVPTYDRSLPPSCQFRGGFKKPVSVLNQYFIRLDVEVEGIFTNFDIEIPIIILTKPKSHSYQPSAPILQYDDQPPSYESVVQNMR